MAKLAKRLLDLTLAGSAVLLLAPLMALIVAATWMSMGRPVLFRQDRIGYRERRFRILKFRTMTVQRDAFGKLLPDRDRLTVLGNLVRGASLDELPQLWSVLKGEMSLVGPRPLLPEYLPRYSAFQQRRHEVKPGITGWAQVRGRNALTWEQKFELDVWYVDNWSPWLDLRILWTTLGKVIRREGISQGGHATMAEFMGAEKLTAET